ncbi:hypothetical protein KOAAANKH_02703 [Brevundimonas sp. NIBR10]|uniref:hypothetical protein n=1 Tax=Brevundimonas sp. NIBR10 TaxID=3015997 RepID=UPI0022F1B8CD|nr:hypothetical protein [Brevundimonas sp. NIBR10]WGM47818.1 hypothetical protein KOAAANKH_02703 [Brevundimonas sp. NIBR10]
MIRLVLISACAVTLAACQQPASEPASAPVAPVTDITPTAAADIPPEVVAVVQAARPGFIVAEAELKEREGRSYYDVEGTLNGAEIEFDLLETPQGWTVVEIQRDIVWTEAPAAVRAAAETARAGLTPVRVIESTQAADGAVIYELFAEGKPDVPSLEVRQKDGKVDVLKEVWPH